jgi:hypothetical protein
MKLVIKGDFEALKSFKSIEGIYTALPFMLKELEKLDFVDDKKYIIIDGYNIYLPNYKVKTIINNSTNTLTINLIKK